MELKGLNDLLSVIDEPQAPSKRESQGFTPLHEWTETVTGAADNSKPVARRYAAGIWGGSPACAVWFRGYWRLRQDHRFAAAEILRLAGKGMP